MDNWLALRVAASLGGQTTGMSDGRLFPVNRRRAVRMVQTKSGGVVQEVEERRKERGREREI